MSDERVLADRYRLERQIGRGGMGQVWSAIDTRLQRRVAVKTVDLAGGADDVAAERFRQEAHATAALSHPNIVTIFDNGVDGSTAYLVMELLSGPSLEDLVHDQGPLPVDEALDHAQSVASALGAAHRAGIVHRDIKPSNLMLDQRGTLKVVDFGIARLDQDRTSKLTATSTVIGSAPYLSPEQATGSTASAQSDLYSLGCVLMTLLTGEPPFAGEHPLSVLHHHLSTTPPHPSERRPGIPAAVDDLVDQLLAKSPQDRPASAADVAARIAAIRRGAAPETTVLPVAGAAATTTVVPQAAPTAPRDTQTRPAAAYAPAGATPAYEREEPRRRRGTGALWFVVLLLLAAVAAMAWMLNGLRGSSNPSPTPTTTVVTSSVATSTTSEDTPTSTRTTRTTEPTTEATTETRTASPTTVTETVTRTATPTSTQTTAPTETATPTSTPTDGGTSGWATTSAAAGALEGAVDQAGLPQDVAKDAGKTVRKLRKAIDKQDPQAARDELDQLGGIVEQAAGAGEVDQSAQAAISAAAESVAAALPA